MARPHRPNPYTGGRPRDQGQSEEEKARRPWRLSHARQETARETKARKRLEAYARACARRPDLRPAHELMYLGRHA